MALPKLNELPSYEVIVPSTKEKVSFRPFLVKEQKVLLMAMESRDEAQILKAVSDTLSSCIEDETDPKDLATFDVEYLFTQIRAKSVGESTEITLACKECGHENKVTINLSEIQITESLNPIIELNDKYKLKMRYPTYADAIRVAGFKTDTLTDEIVQMAKICMDTILTEEEQINIKEETEEEIDSFLDSLTTDQFDKIVEFVMSLPKLKHDIKFTCEECGHENEFTVEGIQSFLS